MNETITCVVYEKCLTVLMGAYRLSQAVEHLQTTAWLWLKNNVYRLVSNLQITL